MPVDVFDRTDFEAALPVSKTSSQPLWVPRGLIQGEWTYAVPVNPGVEILIRSSVRADGTSADTGKDSIRCYLVDDVAHKPLGPKLSKYITRVNGWERRMTETLRELWRIGRMLGACPSCGSALRLMRVKKEGPNKGRLFISCNTCDGHFKWADGGQ